MSCNGQLCTLQYITAWFYKFIHLQISVLESPNTWERTFSPGIECSINLAALERSQQWGSAARINQHLATPCEVGRHTSHPVHGTQDRWRSQSVSRLIVIRPLYYELYAHKVKVQLEYSPVIRAKYHWNKVDNTSIEKVSSEISFFFH